MFLVAKFIIAPIKPLINLFRKEVITFVIIRRYDLGVVDESIQHIAVKPTASISVLAQEVWHLLELPDYCDEVIVLKSKEDVIQLDQLRKGNDPENPYILEVWPPGSRMKAGIKRHSPKCKCCICSGIRKGKQAAAGHVLGHPGKLMPCVCGSKVCEKDWKIIEQEHKDWKLREALSKKKKCVCGSSVCRG